MCLASPPLCGCGSAEHVTGSTHINVKRKLVGVYVKKEKGGGNILCSLRSHKCQRWGMYGNGEKKQVGVNVKKETDSDNILVSGSSGHANVRGRICI